MKVNIHLNNVELDTAIALRRAIMFLSIGCRDSRSKVFKFSEKKLDALHLSSDTMYDLNDLDEQLKLIIKDELTKESRKPTGISYSAN